MLFRKLTRNLARRIVGPAANAGDASLDSEARIAEPPRERGASDGDASPTAPCALSGSFAGRPRDDLRPG